MPGCRGSGTARERPGVPLFSKGTLSSERHRRLRLLAGERQRRIVILLSFVASFLVRDRRTSLPFHVFERPRDGTKCVSHDSHQTGNREKRMNQVNLGPDRLLAGERAASMGQCNAGRAPRRVMSRSLEFSSLFLRIAPGTSFLSAVADRLGLWGGFRQPNVSWGSFARFIVYTATLNWFLP